MLPRSQAAGLVLAMLILAGCGGGGGSASSTAAALPRGCEQVAKPPAKHVDLLRPHGVTVAPGATATVDTSCGKFTIALATASAPKTVESFAYLAKKGVYDDTAFHKVIPNFVIQGGDPLGTGTGGPGYYVDETPPQRTDYTRGTVAMGKTATEPPGRSQSQFFVVVEPDAALPPVYALLGKVRSGMDTVDRIAGLGTPSGAPRAPVVIRRITVRG
jgi:peptidyl-prolyl cis-trans isomerase B (cyclophilin B)